MDSTLRGVLGRVESLEHRMNTAFDFQRSELDVNKKTQKTVLEEMKLLSLKIEQINNRLDNLKTAPKMINF